MKRKKAFLLTDTSFYGRIKEVPIWINEINNDLFPVKFEYRGFRGYKGLVFTARVSEIKFI